MIAALLSLFLAHTQSARFQVTVTVVSRIQFAQHDTIVYTSGLPGEEAPAPRLIENTITF